MSDKRPELNDIYRESSVAEETTTPVKLAETIQQNLRRQFFINLAIGTVSLLLFMAVLLLILSELRMNAGEAETVPRLQAAYVPTFSLPENERWVLDYRQAAAQQEEIVPTNGCPVSTKWVKSAAYHFIMGEQSLMMNDPETAQVHLEKALHIFPAMTGIHRALGTAYLHQKKFEQAADELELALNEGVSVNLLVNLGVASMQAKRFPRAEEVLLQAQQMQPDLVGIHRNLALLYRQTGETEKATAQFDAFFAAAPLDIGMVRLYTDYLISLERTDDALRFLEQLESDKSLDVYLLLARTAAKTGDAELAVSALRNAAQLLPPRLVLVEINDPAFDQVRGQEPFQTLIHRLELAAVSLSSGRDFMPKNREVK